MPKIEFDQPARVAKEKEIESIIDDIAIARLIDSANKNCQESTKNDDTVFIKWDSKRNVLLLDYFGNQQEEKMFESRLELIRWLEGVIWGSEINIG